MSKKLIKERICDKWVEVGDKTAVRKTNIKNNLYDMAKRINDIALLLEIETDDEK